MKTSKPDEVDAYEVGFRRGVRNQLFTTAIGNGYGRCFAERRRKGGTPTLFPCWHRHSAQLERVKRPSPCEPQGERSGYRGLPSLSSLRAWVKPASSNPSDLSFLMASVTLGYRRFIG